MPLFDAQQLGDFIQQDVDPGTAVQVEQVVWGWLQPILGLERRPEPPSPPLYSWAIELGAIAHENPSGLSSYQLGQENRGYSFERRAQILTEVAANLDGTAGTGPVGSFPAPLAWPDPIGRC